VIHSDLGAQLAAILRAAVADGALPPPAAELTAAGSWRPAPAAAGGGPGGYATSLPFRLAGLSGRPAAAIAAMLARSLSGAPGVAAATATGAGYLTVAVTDAALTGLALRIPRAGSRCARSDALAGRCLPAAPQPDLAAAATWAQAWRWQAQAVTTALAAAAGATINAAAQREARASAPRPDSSPVAVSLWYAGTDAVRYALASTPAYRAARAGEQVCVRHDRDNPWYAVSLAHAQAASVLRWAACLGLDRGDPDLLAPQRLGQPRELALLDALSWLPERVAGAARRGRPHELAAYLERLAGAWTACLESCPALPFGGRAAPADPAGITARLWLADAARTGLAAGLELIGVAAPQRL
jgi:arginyl-tRNA synthetase